MRAFLTIILLIFPKLVFGGIGDVYYCTGENTLQIKNHKVTKYKPQNFKFKRSENEINFGSDDNFFKDFILKKKIFSVGEMFTFTDNDRPIGIMKYVDGKFQYSSNTYDNITILTGKCSIF